MPFKCSNCGEHTVTYDNANESSCTECGTTIPNAHLENPAVA